MQVIDGRLDAISYKKRGLKINGAWYDAGDKVDFNDLEKGTTYRFVIADDQKTVIEVMQEKSNGKKVSKKVVKQAKMGNVDLTTINQRLQKLEEQVGQILTTLERGNGYRAAFNVLLDELEDVKKLQRNRDEWTVCVIKQMMSEIEELKKKLNGGGKGE